jgi:hypothetical protein
MEVSGQLHGLVALPELPISTGCGGLQAGMDTMVKSKFLSRQETTHFNVPSSECNVTRKFGTYFISKMVLHV